MTHDELSIDVKSEDGGGRLVFNLRGSLDLATAPTVRAALTEATEKGVTTSSSTSRNLSSWIRPDSVS